MSNSFQHPFNYVTDNIYDMLPEEAGGISGGSYRINRILGFRGSFTPIEA